MMMKIAYVVILALAVLPSTINGQPDQGGGQGGGPGGGGMVDPVTPEAVVDEETTVASPSLAVRTISAGRPNAGRA